MSSIPRDKSLDSTLAMLSEGYKFIPSRCQRYQSDVFETRLMLRKAICAMGEEAAAMFYHPGRFTRHRAMPPNTLMLLQDKGSVQVMDGAAHDNRKQMFMSLMGPESIQQLVDSFTDLWRAYVGKWEDMDRVVLHDEVQEILCRAVCKWAGVPLTPAAGRERTREFAAMIDGAGAVGPRNWKGLLLRRRTEEWMQDLIQKARAGRPDIPKGSAAYTIAWHQDLDGGLLDPEVAAVELINVVRPTVAVAWYITFAALALHQYPESRQGLAAGGEAAIADFVQEVRRFYPFFPFVGGRAREAFEWQGHHFPEGSWVLLDLYGTNHDARSWEDPDSFRPERFRNWNGSPYNFIPQGGGDFHRDHRCAGEWITIELTKTAVRLLMKMRYQVPRQDLGIDLSRMPAIPKSRFVIDAVRAV